MLLKNFLPFFLFFFSSRRRHTRFDCDWSSDVCSSDLLQKCWRQHNPPLAKLTAATRVAITQWINIVKYGWADTVGVEIASARYYATRCVGEVTGAEHDSYSDPLHRGRAQSARLPNKRAVVQRRCVKAPLPGLSWPPSVAAIPYLHGTFGRVGGAAVTKQRLAWLICRSPNLTETQNPQDGGRWRV